MSAEEFDLRTTLKRITPSPFLAGRNILKGKLDTSEGQPSGTVCSSCMVCCVLYDQLIP